MYVTIYYLYIFISPFSYLFNLYCHLCEGMYREQLGEWSPDNLNINRDKL
jgi:hypothetical protein